MNTVWTKPEATRTYTATATNATTGCSSSQSVLVTLNLPVIPENITVTGIIYSGHDSCFNATQTITVAGNGTTFLVQSDASATFIAGHNILYLPGTKVELFGYMHGYITTNNTYCVAPALPSSIVNNIEEETMFTPSSSMFRVYPNPTTGEFTLEVGGSHEKEKVNVGIYGIHGDNVMMMKLEGQARYKLSLSDKPSGVYFVRLISGGTTATLKIIKQ
jgi:hypothetical protein